MAPKLCEEEIVTLQVLRDKGLSFREIAATLGVSEGTVRSHRKRRGQPDGRGKPRKARAQADVIDAWMLHHTGRPDDAEHPRPVTVLFSTTGCGRNTTPRGRIARPSASCGTVTRNPGGGRTAAEEMVEDYNTRWGGDISRVYQDYSY